jgi:hypothetical protein
MKSITVIIIFLLLFGCAHSDLRTPSHEEEAPSKEERTESEQAAASEEEQPREEEEDYTEDDGREKAGRNKSEEKRPEDGKGGDIDSVIVKRETESTLPYWKVVSQAKSYGSPDYSLLYRNGRPYFIRRDLFADNRDDILVVYVSDGEDGEADFSRYSNISRLYEDEDTSFQCHILHFSVTDRGLVPENRYSFGKHKVLEDIRELQIKKNSAFPFALILRFQSVEGLEEKWLIFAEEHVTRFHMKETFSNHSIVTDVDGDGTEDIIFVNKVFEEGTGYETFITWYRWNGRDFIEHKTINIVRNLREFLSKIKAIVIEEQCREFAEMALRPEDVERVKQDEVDYRELCARVFVPVEEEKERRNGEQEGEQTDSPSEREEINPFLTEEKEIMDIIYPEIMENPFMVEGVREELFLLQMRVVTMEGSFLYRAKLAMPVNPFSGQQFYFILQ